MLMIPTELIKHQSFKLKCHVCVHADVKSGTVPLFSETDGLLGPRDSYVIGHIYIAANAVALAATPDLAAVLLVCTCSCISSLHHTASISVSCGPSALKKPEDRTVEIFSQPLGFDTIYTGRVIISRM